MCTSDVYRRSGTRPPGRGCSLIVNEHHTQTLVTSSASKAPRLTQGIWWLPFFDTENERVRPGVTRFWDLTALGSGLSIMLEPLPISCVLGRRSVTLLLKRTRPLESYCVSEGSRVHPVRFRLAPERAIPHTLRMALHCFASDIHGRPRECS